MTRHDPLVRLRHMRDHAREAMKVLEGVTREQLAADRIRTLALIHLVQIIGEAAAKLPQEVRQQHPEIPWTGIIGARNRLVHDYVSVDLDVLWEIVSHDLPPLVEAVEAMIAALQKDKP